MTFSQRGLRRTLSLRESPRPGAENRAGVSPGLTQQEVNRAGYPEPENLTKPRDCPAVRSTPDTGRPRAAVLLLRGCSLVLAVRSVRIAVGSRPDQQTRTIVALDEIVGGQMTPGIWKKVVFVTRSPAVMMSR